MTLNSKIAAAIGTAMLLSSTGAFAATATDSLNVSLTVNDSCSVTATALAFGTTGAITANIDAATTLSVTCTDGTAYAVSMDAGAGASATTAIRKMTNGSSDTVTYGLYQNAGRSTVFGSGSGEEVSGTGSGAAQTINVYGRVPVQAAPAGAYTDTVTVTLTY